MVPTARRAVHRRRPDRARGRVVITVLLALVATGGTAWLVLTASAPERVDPVPLRAATKLDPAAVQECGRAVALARDTVRAAQPSYSHWAGHVRAQVDFDTRTATIEQTRERWAATKATADADISGFRTALAAFDPERGGCAERPGSAGADQDPVLATCRTEFGFASAAVTAATAVVDDWSAHVDMMKGKEHTDPAQYGRMWRDMVTAAPDDLDRFARASLDLTQHVDCPRPR
jgi:hypothetical protein